MEREYEQTLYLLGLGKNIIRKRGKREEKGSGNFGEIIQLSACEREK